LLNTAALTCHPDTSTRVVHAIEACVGWRHDGELEVAYVVKGDIGAVRVPAARPPRRAARLWEHTCFEVFVAVNGRPGYYEFNFAPSGEWAAYKFRRYRKGAPLKDKKLAPCIAVRVAHDTLELGVVIGLRGLLGPSRAELRLALSAVIEDERATLSYWAVRHPPGKPDFHHPDAFALELSPPNYPRAIST
jgi:hypothetical protein